MNSLKFGGKINFLRRAAGISYGELARKSGVPEKTIERICEGKNAPDAANLVRLLRALRVDLDVIEPEDFEHE